MPGRADTALATPDAKAPADGAERTVWPDTRRLAEILARFRDRSVVVVGDLIVDVYTDVEPLGMSQEDPSLAARYLGEARFLGGAGIVAAHAARLGASVSLVTIAGDDEAADFAAGCLSAAGVAASIIRDPARPTTVKQRFRADGRTLLRVHRLPAPPPAAPADRIASEAERRLEGADLLLFADFNHGCLPQAVVDRLSGEARRRDIRAAADCQSSSQIGNICRFRRMDLITPTEREARLAIHDWESDLPALARRVATAADAGTVLLTLGKAGLLVAGPGAEPATALPALNPAPVDPAGAGDALFVGAALALASDAGPAEAALLGSVAAACQVAGVGNTPLTVDELETGLGRYLPDPVAGDPRRHPVPA